MGINRELRYVTAGNHESVSQVFYNNTFANSKQVKTNFFSFNKPMYTTYGGTLNYYGQDPFSIFTNLVRPPIRFVFTANTNSLSGNSYFIHEIYRLDYDTYKLYSDNQIDNSLEITNKLISNTNKVNANQPQPTRNSPNRELDNRSNLKLGNNIIPQPEKFFGNEITDKDKETIQSYFTNPLITLTASTSAMTGNIYDLFIEQYIKKSGNYKSELFIDKAQYLINTKIVFDLNLNKNYNNFFQKNSDSIYPSSWNNYLQVIATNNDIHEIENSPFAGIKVIGNFFTYFIVPDKPVLEYPIMSGALSTFTPEFRWSNGDNADSFLIRINYNTSDTGFTGTVYNYPVEKNEKNSKTSSSKIKGPSDEFSSDKTIYTFQIPVKSRSAFLYQIGNSKEIIDIFDVRRNVVTFSDTYMANSQFEQIKTYVKIESDSKHVDEITGLITPPSLDYESYIGNYVLSGTVSGSTVTGATMQLLYPNNNFITTTTDLNGNYLFNNLIDGSYTLTTNYRGYEQDVRVITLTGNTNLGIKLKLLWSNHYDTWGALAGDNFYI